MRPLSRALAAVFVLLGAACGLSVVGTSTLEPKDDAGVTSSSSSGALPIGDSGSSDAPVDAPACVADLTSDPANCGVCAHDCQGGACASGICQPAVFVANETGVTGVAVGGADLVWTRPSSGLVRRMPRTGGTPTTLSAADAGGLANPTGVTTNSGSVFLTDRGAGIVARFELDGGATWSRASFDSPTDVASDGTSVFFTIQNQDSVWSLPMDGKGDAGLRMSGLNYPASVDVEGGRIFAASGSGILVAPKDGGAPVSNVSPTSRFKDGGGDLIHTGVIVEGPIAWFTIESLGIVASIPATGGVATVLASGQAAPIGIAVTPTTIYWANRDAGTIMKLAR